MVARPFRFIRAWMSHEKYNDFITDNWGKGHDFMDSLNSFTQKLQKWNKEVFGNSFRQKQKLLARIAGIQRVLEHRGVPSLNALEIELKEELDKILLREESLWHQKSCNEWVHLEDRITSFFHLQTIRRRKCNRIEMLQNGEGEWVQDQGQLKLMVVTFYDDLYCEDNLHRPLYGHGSLFSSISPLQAEEIRKQFTAEDVRAALFEMKPWKALRVDGIQAGFYQKHWEIVGGDISAEVIRILEGGDMNAWMNQTIICLIPKTEVPKSLTQFRPISLYNVVYKFVTKTIATRLKKLMPVIVGPTQSSFVAGRHMTDNIVIAQEAIHSMRSMKGNHRVKALKVDLEKAYDRVSWAFFV